MSAREGEVACPNGADAAAGVADPSGPAGESEPKSAVEVGEEGRALRSGRAGVGAGAEPGGRRSLIGAGPELAVADGVADPGGAWLPPVLK